MQANRALFLSNGEMDAGHNTVFNNHLNKGKQIAPFSLLDVLTEDGNMHFVWIWKLLLKQRRERG